MVGPAAPDFYTPPPMARSSRPTFTAALQAAFLLVGLMFLIKAVEVVVPVSFAGYGIIPRNEHGLIGIVFSPLLHGNAQHLLANAAPLLVLLTLLFWDRKYHPWRTLAFIWLASGLGTWLIGRGETGGQLTVHIGASSVIYGLVVYLLVAGFLMDSWRAVFVAVGVGVAYGGIFYGVLPQSGPISWEGHLCGAIAGFFTARHNHA